MDSYKEKQRQHPIKTKFLGAVRKKKREQAISDIFIVV
jgi:hypothetical protein